MNKKMFHPLIVIAIVLGGVTPTIAQQGKITAREVVAAIQKHVGVECRRKPWIRSKRATPIPPSLE